MTLYLQEKEFYCNTCKQNLNIEPMLNFVNTQSDNKEYNYYIPMKTRRTKKTGLVFTEGSVMFVWHKNHGEHHDWGNVADAEKAIEAEKKALEALKTSN